MNFYFNCYICNKRFNFQENYCENCLNRISGDQERVFQLIDSIIVKKRENALMRKKIESGILSDDIVKIENQKKAKESTLNAKLQAIEALKERIRLLQESNAQEAQKIDNKMKYLSKRRTHLKGNMASFAEGKVREKEVQGLTKDIERAKSRVGEIQHHIEAKKKNMVEILTNKILKVKVSPTDPNMYNIINILLNDRDGFAKMPKDIVFITVGYIARITILISNYLGISVPNELVYRGSNSYVQRPGRVYSLYYHKSSQSHNFQKALYLLGENISFIRYFYGMFTPRESITHFLTNLSELIASSNLGKDKFTDLDKKYSNFINLEETNDEDWEMISNIDTSRSSSSKEMALEYNPLTQSTPNVNINNPLVSSVSTSSSTSSSYSPRKNSLLSMLSSNSFFKKTTPPTTSNSNTMATTPTITTTTSIISNPSTSSSVSSLNDDENIDQFVTDL